mmetsp:Transcript_12558/g.28754  ORF Transcript_12558/g.28754 Transcript_12558/m.28754 type:complete len:88 (-) Transcript_12558:185-448(-)
MTNGISSIVVPSLPLDLVDELETISNLGFTYCSQDELDALAATNARRRPPSPSDDSAASGITDQSPRGPWARPNRHLRRRSQTSGKD